MNDYAFFFDASRCTGCLSCQVACKSWNGLPPERGLPPEGGLPPENKEEAPFQWNHRTIPRLLSARTWTLVREQVKNRDNFYPFISFELLRCRHCKDPNCMVVCPTGAIDMDEGWVLIDSKKCIGCQECVYACPFMVPSLSDRNLVDHLGNVRVPANTVAKCDACRSRPREIPACVEACPSSALTFDYRARILIKARERRDDVQREYPDAFLYGIHEFGGLRVISLYLFPEEMYDLPASTTSIRQNLD